MIPYVIRSTRGGVSDENRRGLEGSFSFGYGLDIHNRLDALRAGSTCATILDASTGELGSGTTRGTTLNSHFNMFVPSFDGTTYCFGATGSIMAVSPDGYWTNVYNDTEAITGAGEFGLDDGTVYMFWGKSTSYARRRMGTTFDTARDSGQAIWGNSVEQVWKTEGISSTAVWHSMANASGALMIANGEGLSVLDFDGDFDPLKVNVRPGNLINAIEERDDYTIFGSERNDTGEEGHLWAWIVTALNYIQKKRIPVQGVNALVTAEQSLLQGGYNGEIFSADFTSSVPLATIPGGGHVIPGGVTVHEDLAAFGIFGGSYPGIWTYGRRHINRSPALNYQYRLSPTVGGSTVATIGAVAVINGTLMASWGITESDSSSYGVDAVSSTTRATALYEGLEFDGGQAWNKKLVDSVHVTCAPLPSGTSFSIKYKADKDSWHYTIYGDGSTTYSTAGATEAISALTEPSHILEIGAEINPSGSDTPEIYEIATYLSNQVNAY